MHNQVIILAAGKGARMGELDLPKILVGLRGKPLISYILEELKIITDLPTPVLVVGYKNVLVKELLGKNYIYALQKQQLGTAHAVWSAKKKIKAKNVLVLYGDMPFIKAESLKKLIKLHQNQDAVISMFTSYVPSFSGKFSSLNNYGRIIRDKYSALIKITEYKDASEKERQIREVNPGIYMFKTEWLWDNIDKINNKNAQQEFYLTDLIEVAIAEGKIIHSFKIAPREFLGVNTKEQLQQAEKLIT